MANGSFKVKKSLNIEPLASPTLDQDGDIAVDSSTNKLKTRLNSTTEVVTTDAGTSTLTNKTIDADSNTITNIENADIKSAAAIDATKIADGSVSNTEFQYLSTVTSNVQTQLDAKASTTLTSANILVGNGSNVATAVAVTGDVTLSNAGVTAIASGVVVNDDISASAAVDRSKLASGTASHVIINDGAGVLSSEASLDETRGGTGFTSLTTGDLPYASASNVFSKLPIGTSNQILTVSGGIPAWAAAPAGGINYMSANNNAETDATSWTTYNDDAGAQTATAVDTSTEQLTCNSHGLVVGDVIYFSAIGSLTGISTNTRYYVTSTPTVNTFTLSTTRAGTSANLGGTIGTTTFRKISFVNGDGGSVSGSDFTWTRGTSNPLRGTGEFLFTKLTNATAAGNGISFAFTPDRADRNNVLTFSFDMEVSSGTYSDDDIEIWIYDVTNSVAIQPTPFYLKSVVAGTNVKITGQFQTSSSQSYRFCLHNLNPTTTGYVLKLDNFVLSPSYLPQGTPITDWQAYTPTFQGLGTVASIEMSWRRVGDSAEIKGKFTSGTATGVELQVGLPPGLTSADTTRIPTIQVCGNASTSRTDSNAPLTVLIEPSKTYVVMSRQQSASGGLTKLLGNGIVAAADLMSFFAVVPITGWSSNAVMSSDADTRVVAAKYRLGSDQAVSANAVVPFNTKVFDTHGAFNTSTYLFVAPLPGFYQIQAEDLQTTVANGGLYVKVNGTDRQYIGTVNALVGFCLLELKAGDTVGIYTDTARTFQYLPGLSIPGCQISVFRLSGPTQIMASETVAASYYETSAHSVSTTTPLNFDTKIVDTHGAVTTGSGWRFTAPMAGVYQINVTSRQSSTNGGCRVYKNGAFSPPISLFSWQANVTMSGSCMVSMIAGDYIDIRASASITTSSDFATDPGVISISRVSR